MPATVDNESNCLVALPGPSAEMLITRQRLCHSEAMAVNARRKHAWGIAVAIAVVLLVTASGCEATPATVELRNESEDHLLWMKTSPELLAQAVAGNERWATIPPGGMSVKDLSAAFEPDWCETSAVVSYLLRPLDGRPIGPDQWPLNIDLDDFEIIAERGPGYCWGEKHAVWTFDG